MRHVQLTWQQHLAIENLEWAARWEDPYAEATEFSVERPSASGQAGGAITITLVGSDRKRTVWRIEEDGSHARVAEEPVP